MRKQPVPCDRRTRVAFMLWSSALFAAPGIVAAQTTPREARITTPGALVLSGPGEQFYPTDTLAQGDVVEIYREEPGGWLGIRPPQDSYSWVFGQHLKRLDNNLAEVDKADVPSRIGSRMSDKRNAVQVRLKKGEQVEIVGEQSVDNQVWYKIAPPSGEFRWVHARHVADSTVPMTDAAAPSTAPAPVDIPPPPVVIVPVSNDQAATSVPQIVLAADSQSPVANSPNPTVGTASRAEEPTWRAAPLGSTAAAATPTLPVELAAPPLATSDASATPARAPETPITPIDARPESAASTKDALRSSEKSLATAQGGPVADNLARRLTDAEMRLSRIVAEPPATWQIEPLAREAEQLLSQATTPNERQAVQTTLTKIDRFAVIGRRYRQAGTTLVAQPLAGSGQPTADAQRYDAVGILRPVVSKRPGAPQFALVNERGQVVSFVTPTPDVNLQPYVGYQVGVTGSRGYIPEFQRAHVTAGRVAPLNQTLLR